MSIVSMPFRALRFACLLIREGKVMFLLRDAWTRLYKQIYAFWFLCAWRLPGRLRPCPSVNVALRTEHPLADSSLDHLHPAGTAHDNSTNRYFVLFMNRWVRKQHPGAQPAMLDLGCAGGQLVRDFHDMGWLAVGLEGSNYSQTHRRANWPELGNRNLFICDITQPFTLTQAGTPISAHLITAWEVLEHIPPEALPQLLDNIQRHLAPGGMFIATTTSEPAVINGVNLHQCMWANAQWKDYFLKHLPDWRPVELPLRYYQYVRHNPEGSFLVFQRQGA